MPSEGGSTSTRILLYVLTRLLARGVAATLPISGNCPESDNPGTIILRYKGRAIGYINSDVLSKGYVGFNELTDDAHTGKFSEERARYHKERIEAMDFGFTGKAVVRCAGASCYVILMEQRTAVAALTHSCNVIDGAVSSGTEA